MPLLTDMISTYQSYSWIFDGIIICTVLGMLFRILFAKAKISSDDKQSKKFGGVVGFFMGIVMIGYMQYRGWTLFIDGGPWVFTVVILAIVGVLWSIIDGYLQGKSRSITLPIAFVVALGLIYGFLSYIPSYMAGVQDIFGEWTILWHIFIWAMMVFILFWALAGMMAGGGPRGYRRAGRDVWKGIKKAGSGLGWLAKKPVQAAGAIGSKIPGIKRAFKRKPGEAPTTPEETEQTQRETDQRLEDAHKKTEKADKALDAAKAIHQDMARILNQIRGLAKNAQTEIGKMNPADRTAISTYLQTKLKELKAARKQFAAIDFVGKLTKAREAVEMARAETQNRIAEINNYTGVKELITEANKIQDENKRAGFLQQAEAERKYLQEIKARLQQVFLTFENAIKEVLTEEHITKTKKDVLDLQKRLDAIEALTAGLAGELPDAKDKPAQGKAAQAGATLVTQTTLAIEQLGTLNNVIINGILKQGTAAAEAAIERYIKTKRVVLEDFMRVQKDIQAMLAQIRKLLTEQISAKERATMVTALKNIKNTIGQQKQELLTLIEESEKFIKAIKKAWTIEKETKRKMETAVAITEKKTTEELIKQKEEEARAQITAAINIAKKEQEDTVKILNAGAATVKKAKEELARARNMLSQLMQKTAGKRRQNIEMLISNLNYMLKEEEEIQKGMNFLRDYETYIINTVLARTEEPKKKRKIGSVVYELTRNVINPLKKIVEMLDQELIFITKEEKEFTKEPVPPPAPSGGFTSERVPAPPPAT